jgi:hypothetical protein
MAGMAGKPESYFIIPAAALTGEDSVVRVTDEAGAYPGTVIPDDANRGLLLPLQSGRVLNADAEDRRMRLLAEGAADGAPWIWQDEGAAADAWYGSDDPRYFTRYHAPTTAGNPGSDNCALVYSSAYRRLLAFAVDDTVAPSVVSIFYRGVDDDYATNMKDWISTSFALRTLTETGTQVEQIADGKNGARAAELDDGTLVLVLRVRGAQSFTFTEDFNVYHSADGGLTWALVADAILSSIDTGGSASGDGSQNTDVQFALAVSGSQLRLTWRQSGAGLELYDAVSTDRGVTWAAVIDAAPPVVYDNGQASTPSNFATVGVDDRGRWLMITQDTVSPPDQTFLYYATDSGIWEPVLFSSEGLPDEVFGLMLVRANGWIWQFIQWSDKGGGTNDGWTVRRAPADNTGGFGGLIYGFAGWQTLEPSVQHNASIYVTARPAAVWAGDRFAFYTANKGAISGAEINLPSYWEGTRGWNQRSLGIIGLGANFAEDSDVGGTSVPYVPGAYLPLWWNHWNMRQGDPDTGPYVRNTFGAGSFSLTMAGGFPNSPGIGDGLTFTLTDATEPWRGVYTLGASRHFGSAFEWVTKVESAGTPSRGDYGVRIKMGNFSFTQYCEVQIWIYANTVELVDVVASVTRATLTVPDVHLNTAGMWRMRLVKVQGPANDQVQLAVRDESDVSAEWVESGVLNLSFALVAGNNELEFGNFAKTGAGALQTRWSEVSINNRDSLRQIGTRINAGGGALAGYQNPRDLIGMQARAGEPVEVGDGLSVTLAGAGGALNDEFALQLAHTYAAEHVFVDSPRIQWRTIAAPVNALSSPNEFGGSEWVKNVSSATNTTADNTQTAPDGTLTASRVTYTRALAGSTVIFLRANGASQSPPATLAPSTPYRGWTLTFWMRHTEPTALTFVMDVSDGPGGGSVSVPNDGVWRRFRVNVPRNGNGGAPGGWLDFTHTGYTPGTLVTVDLWGMKLTADPEIVVAVDPAARDADDFDAVGVFGCNARTLRIDRSDDVNFGSGSAADELDLQRYASGGAVTVAGYSSATRTVTFAAGTFPDAAEREPVTEYLYAEDGVQSLTSYPITRQRDRAGSRLFYLDDVPTDDAATHFQPGGGTATSEFTIYGDSGSALLSNASSGLYRYLRVRIIEQEPPEGDDNFHIGNLVLGQRLSLDVPLEWSHTDNEQPNVTSYRTRSAVSWAYREGPPQRTLTTRLVGDWDDRQRDRLRAMQRELSYEVRPLVLVLDADRPNEAAMLGRITSGNQQDQAMWWEDAQGVYRTAGDLSLTFVEEV